MSAIEKISSSDELQAENRLLLRHLHQVQEELERFYLQNRHQNKQLALLESRIKQLQSLPAPKLTFLQKSTDWLGYTSHQDIAEIRNSEYMDSEWYLEQNPDVKQSGVDAVEHYYKYGWKEGRAPGPRFSSSDYLSNNPDVANASVEPLLHYIRYGKKEGRFCFDASLLDEGSVLLAQIEELRSERSSAVSRLYQVEQDYQSLQSKYELAADAHQQLEKRYQRESDDWQKTETAHKEQTKQQVEQLQQLEQALLVHEQALEQHRRDQADWESAAKQSQENVLQQAGVIEQLQSRMLEVQGELSQLSLRYEQVKELQSVEREAWGKAEAIYKDQLRQQEVLVGELRSHILQLQAHIGDKFNNLLNEQKNQLGSIQKALNKTFEKNINNATRQIESFIGVQNYLKDGAYPFDFHGWPISPDIALFLLNQIEDNNYDLIIEFGSGTSTALFAEALVKKNQRLTPQAQFQLENSESSSQAMQVYYEPAFSDLPRRVVTFEHNKKYYDQTLDRLIKMKLDQAVDLVYAPLVDFQFKEDSYLYYSCNSKLEELAKAFEGRRAKILVLVDGPPAATCPLARFPALPSLLKYFSSHTMTIVLDDFLRKEEQEIRDRWEGLLEARSIAFTKEEFLNEKGMYVCHINPD